MRLCSIGRPLLGEAFGMKKSKESLDAESLISYLQQTTEACKILEIPIKD
jgi:hypothetical protein